MGEEDSKPKADTSYRRDQVVCIINSVISKVKEEQEPRENICRELGELKGIIESLRKDLSAAQPADISETHIPAATDELDAIVGTTEQATMTIMDACETILQQMSDAGEELQQQTETQVVRIYEACTFQDLTGQRIKKVVDTLKRIDEKTSQLLTSLEDTLNLDNFSASEEESDDSDNLLNGPALPKDAVTQDDIDKLLAEFD